MLSLDHRHSRLPDKRSRKMEKEKVVKNHSLRVILRRYTVVSELSLRNN